MGGRPRSVKGNQWLEKPRSIKASRMSGQSIFRRVMYVRGSLLHQGFSCLNRRDTCRISDSLYAVCLLVPSTKKSPRRLETASTS